MILNLLILMFLGFMAFFWAKQGLFSAFLHLMMVIVAGSLALALWEPVSYLLLGVPYVQPYAWGVGMMLPFLVVLLVLRIAGDRLVRGNVHYNGLVSQAGGAVCGLIAGMLSAGITIIALGFLGLPSSDINGYQPYAVSTTGEVIPNPDGADLWIGVDEMAAGLFSRLSRGGFYASSSLAMHHPSLAREAAVFHLRYDANASVVSVPEGVSLERVLTLPVKDSPKIAAIPSAVEDAMGAGLRNNANRIVLVDTKWSNVPGVAAPYDTDDTLRVPPTQVRLLTHRTQSSDVAAKLHAPLAFSKLYNSNAGEWRFYPVDSQNMYASSDRQEQRLAWLFIIPADRELSHVLLRNMRIAIPDETDDSPEAIVQTLGAPPPAEPAEGEDGGGGEPVRTAEGLKATNALPRPVSKNQVTGLTWGADGSSVESGNDTARGSSQDVSGNIRVDAISKPDHKGMVRLALPASRAQSLLGQAVETARQAQSVWVKDNRGDMWEPIAYVWDQNAAMEINVDRTQKFGRVGRLPLNQMGDDHTLYLYFLLPSGVSITEYKVGDRTETDLNLPVD